MTKQLEQYVLPELMLYSSRGSINSMDVEAQIEVSEDTDADSTSNILLPNIDL